MLPGEAYTKGFLRTYAEHLGLNSQLYIDEYNARIARPDEDPPRFVPHPAVEERSLKRGILVALAAVLVVGAAVAGLAAWQLGGTSSPRSQSSPPPSGAGSVAAAASTPPAVPDDDAEVSDRLRCACVHVHHRRPRTLLAARPERRPERCSALRRHPRAGPGQALPDRLTALGAHGSPRPAGHQGRWEARRRPAGVAVERRADARRRGLAVGVACDADLEVVPASPARPSYAVAATSCTAGTSPHSSSSL